MDGSIYPQADLAAFGVTAQDIFNEKMTPQLRALMKFQVERADQYYTEAIPGISLLKTESQYAIYSAARIYRGILRKIEDRDYNPFFKPSFRLLDTESRDFTTRTDSDQIFIGTRKSFSCTFRNNRKINDSSTAPPLGGYHLPTVSCLVVQTDIFMKFRCWGELPEIPDHLPLLLLPNHSTWWDGFFVYLLNKTDFSPDCLFDDVRIAAIKIQVLQENRGRIQLSQKIDAVLLSLSNTLWRY